MSHLILIFAMPFLGIRVGVPMMSGKGTGNVAPAFNGSLDFSNTSDPNNSQYLTLVAGI